MPKIIKKYDPVFFTLILLAALSMPAGSYAQGARKMERRADESFKNKAYYNAAKLYASLLYDSAALTTTPDLLYPYQPANHGHSAKVRSSHRATVLYQLAESYRLCYHYKEALAPYEQYLASQDTKFPLARLWYGNCLIADNEPEKAIAAFTLFLKNYKKEDGYTQSAKLGIASGHFIIKNKSLRPQAAIVRLAAAVSADGSNFGLDKINDSSFWFSTSRHERNKQNETIYPVRLYSGKFNSGQVEKIAALAVKDMNTGASSLSADGLTLYFTGWKDNVKLPGTYTIFYMKRAAVDSSWSTPVALPDPVNVTGFNSRQPFITKDNSYLFFSSDRPGGSGQYDIWMVQMNGRQPVSAASNLGNTVNTMAEEASPFYDADSSCLYFSSDGREGMGGMDIYKVSGNPGANQWSANVTNLGYPYNSVKNDLYFSKDARSDTTYLSSDRSSSCCLELFKAVRLPYKDTTAAKDSVLINMAAIQSKRLQDSLNSVAEDERIRKRLMDSINEITVQRAYINYNFASTRIRRTDHAQLNTMVRMMKNNPTLNILVASFTDCIGTQSNNIRLSRRRSESVEAYLLEKGIDASRINIDFFGKKHFIMPCREDSSYDQDKQIANRRSDLVLTTEKKPKWRPSGKELDIKEVAVGVTDAMNSTAAQSIGDRLDAAKKPVSGNNNTSDDNTADKKRSLAVSQPQKNRLTNKLYSTEAADNNKRKQVTARNLQQEKAQPVTAVVPDSAKKVITRRSADVLPDKMAITELLDFTPRLKAPDVVAEMTKRIPRKPLYLYSTSDSVNIELYDNGVFDYDSVSVIYNKKLIVYKQLLQVNKPISFYVKLDSDQSKNEMIFFAENLGLTPPNSALMVITDGENKRTEVNVASDLDHNTVVYFIKVKK